MSSGVDQQDQCIQIKPAHPHTVSDRGRRAHNKAAVNSCKTTRTTTAQCITTESHLNCSKYDAMYDVGVAQHTPTQLLLWACPQRQSGALPGWQGVEVSPPSGRTQWAVPWVSSSTVPCRRSSRCLSRSWGSWRWDQSLGLAWSTPSPPCGTASLDCTFSGKGEGEGWGEN